jgi:hypothetical protein
MQLSRIIAFPFIIALLVILYLVYDKYMENIVLYLVADVIILAVIFVLAPQINWIGYKKWVPKLPSPVVEMIYKFFPFYQKLSLEDKKKFRDRTSLYMKANDFQAQGMESFPEDIKGMIGAAAAMYTFQKEDFLLSDFEHIIVYKHSFPSPQYPESLHNSEIYAKDGAVILNIQAFMQGLVSPNTTFNLLFYEYARIYLHHYPGTLQVLKTSEEELKMISGWPKEYLDKTIGVPVESLEAVLLSYYFIFPDRIASVLGNDRMQGIRNSLS